VDFRERPGLPGRFSVFAVLVIASEAIQCSTKRLDRFVALPVALTAKGPPRVAKPDRCKS
jgi:hypothetical protein